MTSSKNGRRGTSRAGRGRAQAGAVDEAQTAAVLAEFARHLAAASQQQQRVAEPDQLDRAASGELVRRTPAQIARVRAGVDRSMRIEAGRRARRLPYLATAATAAAGYTAWGATELAGALAGPAGTVAATTGTGALCAAALAGLRIAYRHGIDERWAARWWASGLGASAWVTSAAAIGPASATMSAALAAGAAAVSAGWLRAHEVPDPLAAPMVSAAPPPADDGPDLNDFGEVIAARWAETISPVRGVVPKAMLTNREDLPTTIRWTIQTQPGSLTFDELLGRKGRMASGLRLPVNRVLLEPGEDASTAQLSVITRDLLAAGVPYTGPRYHNGLIEVGPFADGTGAATYVVYDDVGCRNGLASGAPGSGKSAFLEAIGLALRASNEWYVMFGDGDPGGGSSPLLNTIAHWPEAGPERVLAQLEALEAELEVRTMLKATLTLGPDGRTPVPITDPATQLPVREMIPCPAYPGIYWILDELHRLTKDPWLVERKFAERLERLARIGRKYGIVLLTGTQSLLAEDFGNRTPLRSYLSARNLFAFRNTNKSESAVVNGLTISPAALLEGGGYAFSAGDGRLAMLRVAWSRDMGRHAVGLPWAQLDPDSDLALAPWRPTDSRDPADVYAAQMDRLHQWRTAQQTGGPDPRSGAAPDRSPTGPAHPSDRSRTAGPNLGGPFAGTGLTGLRIPAALTAANVIPLRRTGPSMLEDGPDLDTLRPPQRAVYDALQAGLRRTGDIAEHTGMRLPAVSKALQALGDYGLAERFAHGEWQPTQRREGAS